MIHLDLRFGEHGLNGGGEFGQVIRTDNEDILHATVHQTVGYRGPIFGALIFNDPH